MRQVFSSTRLETVEGVAKLLGQYGIQTRITNGRSYKGGRRGGFSYRDKNRNNKRTPTVWVVFPDDQPKAREVLRAAGLMDTTRDSYLPEARRPAPKTSSPMSHAARARMWMLILVVVLAGFSVLRTCQQADTTRAVQPVPAAAPAPVPPAEPEDDRRHIVPVDTSGL